MKKFLKNPLKVIVTGLFALAVSVGLSTGLSVGESDSNIDLLALSSAVAQGETVSGYYPRWESCGGCCCTIEVIKCRTGSGSCNVSDQTPCDMAGGCHDE